MNSAHSHSCQSHTAQSHASQAMRLVGCLAMWLMPILVCSAQTEDQAPSDPQAYCVNRGADFYPYRGEPLRFVTLRSKGLPISAMGQKSHAPQQ
jgi:hypothetical protein